MKTKKQSWPLPSGTKGFIFSLDAAIALFIVFMVLIASLYYVTRKEDSLSNLQLVKTGYDIITILDNDGSLKTVDSATIEQNLNDLLPVNYHYRLEINTTKSKYILLETSNEIPEDQFIGVGKRFFVANTNEFGIAKFWIWVK